MERRFVKVGFREEEGNQVSGIRNLEEVRAGAKLAAGDQAR
jgi:hypothetical protein